ncbi:hypothetical protein GIB67_005274 [Kingdonia uniflora]|uniref:Uncharacterized protein n=1 Tax=Kingdonia uniflora TaxID=39325 RepID=A0A7J7NNY2_9MAGN|nr:hypothetical protein GIB67_005274 [Kingdonia uniflora]
MAETSENETLNESSKPSSMKPLEIKDSERREEQSLYSVFSTIFTSIFFPDSESTTSLFQRIKTCFDDNGDSLREGFRRTTRNLLHWTKQGSPIRALLVISVGTCTFLALSGFLVFMIFFVGATINAIIISLLVSLAAAGGFLAIFFAFMTAIYIGALSVAAFVIASTTITTIFAILITTGWIGFFFTLWMAAKKSAGLAKHSLRLTGSVISSYSAAR